MEYFDIQVPESWIWENRDKDNFHWITMEKLFILDAMNAIDDAGYDGYVWLREDADDIAIEVVDDDIPREPFHSEFESIKEILAHIEVTEIPKVIRYDVVVPVDFIWSWEKDASNNPANYNSVRTEVHYKRSLTKVLLKAGYIASVYLTNADTPFVDTYEGDIQRKTDKKTLEDITQIVEGVSVRYIKSQKEKA